MNRCLKDDIRDYWEIRAQTYDQSIGHGAMSAPEADAWLEAIWDHLGTGRAALDLGCGTGVMSALLHRAGFRVTGLDFAEPMLARAKTAGIACRIADAENTMEPDRSQDAILARNLLWTLPDPAAALRDWFRVLRPGGRLMIIDGDFARESWIERLLGPVPDGHSLLTPAQWAAHRRIMARLPFGAGLRDRDVVALLRAAGFTAIRRAGIGPVLRARHPNRLSRAALVAHSQHRFIVSAARPSA
ncbi:class I SAM-dependent methyltransferase [Paenirhodobacter sp.]|uniref:class I SAM-dependent methyltransferase n=1 Tax=Paenirhodobacter sp. TaxID=1965326 RepID=UPI003B41B8B7